MTSVSSVKKMGEMALATLPALVRILHQVPICEGANHFLSRMAHGGHPAPCTTPTVNHTMLHTYKLFVIGNTMQPIPLSTRPRENNLFELKWSESKEPRNLLTP